MKYIFFSAIVIFVFMFYLALFKAAAEEDRYLEEEFNEFINNEVKDNLE